MELRRRTIEPAYGDTCRWILDTDQYLRWRDEALQSKHHGFLWIKGKPGVGKSTIMKFLLEHAQISMPECTILSFFFNARGSSLETSAQGLYRSLLSQLFDKLPMLRQVFQLPGDFPANDAQEPRWEVEVIQDLFREALIQARQQPVIILIDALDEGNHDEVRNIMEYIAKLASNARAMNSRFHICFASRHYPSFTIPFCEELILERQKHHKEDIQKYVSENLAPGLTTKRLDLVAEVVAKSQEVFLWIFLVVRLLNDQFSRGFSRGQLTSSLNSIPDDLEKLLTDILRRGASDKYLVPALKWVTAGISSHGSLTVVPLYFGILLETGELSDPAWDHHEIDIATMERFVLQATKGLVELIEPEEYQDERTVQFIHESVRQHLVDRGLTILAPFLKDRVEARCHAEVAECCQAYLRLVKPARLGVFVDATTGVKIVPQQPLIGRQRDIVIQRFPLIVYAVDNTFFHLEAAHAVGVYTLDRLHSFPLQTWIHVLGIIEPSQDPLLPSASLLYLLIEHGCLDMVKDLLQCNKMLHDPGGLGSGSAQAADGNRANALIGPDINAPQTLEGMTSLSLAIQQGDRTVVQMILECGADANLGSPMNPLLETVWRSRIDMARLLLEHGADANTLDNKHNHALGLAAWKRDLDFMDLLLDYGANDTVTDDYNGNILIAAARDGFTELVELLIRHGANVNVVAKAYGTALAAAAHSGHTSVVKLLLQHGASVHVAAGRLLPTALAAAISAWNFDMVKLLLEHGANINQSSSSKGVHFALREARLAARRRKRTDEDVPDTDNPMAQFLLENGASEPGNQASS